MISLFVDIDDFLGRVDDLCLLLILPMTSTISCILRRRWNSMTEISELDSDITGLQLPCYVFLHILFFFIFLPFIK